MPGNCAQPVLARGPESQMWGPKTVLCPGLSYWLWKGADCYFWAGVPGWLVEVRAAASLFARSSCRPLSLWGPTAPPSKASLHFGCTSISPSQTSSVCFRGPLWEVYSTGSQEASGSARVQRQAQVTTPALTDRPFLPFPCQATLTGDQPYSLRKKSIPNWRSRPVLAPFDTWTCGTQPWVTMTHV